MKIVDKAVAAMVRTKEGRRELLVFTHPLAGVQIPKGTIEPDESIALATMRELEEESGLTLPCAPAYLGTWERIVKGGQREGAATERHPWHASILAATPDLPERWEHRAAGSPEEDGLIFAFHWLPIDDDRLAEKLHPVFADVARMLLGHFAS